MILQKFGNANVKHNDCYLYQIMVETICKQTDQTSNWFRDSVVVALSYFHLIE